MKRFDVAIIGAGMAGASLAAELAPHALVLLLEAEDHPGYHATGRSAAFWSETYGGPGVQPLTTASWNFLAAPPADVSDRPFVSPRGALHVADEEGRDRLRRLQADFDDADVELRPLSGDEVSALVPTLRPEWHHAVLEPSCADIDVAGLHQAYLRAGRRAGAGLVAGAAVTALERDETGWRITTRAGDYRAHIVANAAGAWADQVAQMAGARPLGLRPYRRTLIQLAVDLPAPAALPLVIDARESFYFKPEAGGRLWLSPHDETACDPCDAAPEEIDVARAIARLEAVTDWRVLRVERRWAGLRTFAPDRRPIYGLDPRVPGLFWCAGQGGFGIQTAPAAAKLAAALLLQRAPAIDPAPYLPARFGR